jgi:hypothetical protein
MSYDELMSDVIDIKDLGSGVVGAVECDYLAFRKKEVDFQIWIAQGDKPYPCRFSITSRMVPGSPQYSIQLRDWKTSSDAARHLAQTERRKGPDGPRGYGLGDGESRRVPGFG